MKATLIALFQYKAWTNNELLDALSRFDAQQYPSDLLAMLRILDHANVVDRIFQGHLAGEPSSFRFTRSEDTPTLAALWDSVQATDKWYLEFVSAVDFGQLRQRQAFTFVDGEKGSMSSEEMLLHVITHAAYHRGSIGHILESRGLDSPPDSLTKYLHRHEPARRFHPIPG